MDRSRILNRLFPPKTWAVAALSSLVLANTVNPFSTSVNKSKPQIYDIRGMGCSPSKAKFIAQLAINQHQGFKTYAVRTSTAAVNSDIFAQDKKTSFLSVNPPVLVCNGKATDLLGAGRDFYGQGTPHIESESLEDTELKETIFDDKYNTHNDRNISIPHDQINKFIVEDVIRDEGSSQTGVTGLTGLNSDQGYGIMP